LSVIFFLSIIFRFSLNQRTPHPKGNSINKGSHKLSGSSTNNNTTMAMLDLSCPHASAMSPQS
jgi:hypothetical protein